MTVPGPAVAYDVTPLLSFRTGIGLATYETWSALARLGDGPRLVPYALGMRARPDVEGAPPGIRIVRYPTRLLLALWGRSDHPSLARTWRGVDVLHATNYVVPPARLPTLVTVNDVGFVLDPTSADRVVGTFPDLLRRAVGRGAQLHVPTEQVAGEVDTVFGPGLRAAGRIHVVPYGVPPAARAAPLPPDLAGRVAGSPYVLAVGRHDSRKNLARLLQSFGLISAELPDLKLVIAGPEGGGTAALHAALDGLPEGVQAQVTITGPVGRAVLQNLLEGATVLAYPSLYEGFGFPPLEAMVAGVPVLVGRGGAVGEVAGPAALAVDAEDTQDLAAGLARLVSDDDLRNRLIEAGRSHAAGFSWERTARGLAQIYVRLATSS